MVDGGITIRRATSNDVPWLVSQLKIFSSFFGSKIALFKDDESAAQGIASMAQNHLVLVADREGEQLGFIAGITTPHMFNPDIKVLAETFWWVEEKHRKTRAGLLLLNAFVEYGKENANWTVFTLEHHSPVHERALLRRGFKLQERSYLAESTQEAQSWQQ